MSATINGVPTPFNQNCHCTYTLSADLFVVYGSSGTKSVNMSFVGPGTNVTVNALPSYLMHSTNGGSTSYQSYPSGTFSITMNTFSGTASDASFTGTLNTSPVTTPVSVTAGVFSCEYTTN